MNIKYIYKEVTTSTSTKNLLKIIHWCLCVILTKFFRKDIDSISVEPWDKKDWRDSNLLFRLKAWFGVDKNFQNIIELDTEQHKIWKNHLYKIKQKEEKK